MALWDDPYQHEPPLRPAVFWHESTHHDGPIVNARGCASCRDSALLFNYRSGTLDLLPIIRAAFCLPLNPLKGTL